MELIIGCTLIGAGCFALGIIAGIWIGGETPTDYQLFMSWRDGRRSAREECSCP